MHALKRKRALLFLADIVSFYAALVSVLWFRSDFANGALAIHLPPFTLLFAAWLLVFFLFDLYEPDAANPTPRTVGKLLLACIVNFFLGALFFYAGPAFGIEPKANLLLVSLVSCVLAIGLRRLIYHIFNRGLRKTIAFYGPALKSPLHAELEQNEHFKLDTTPITALRDLELLQTRPDILVVPEEITTEELALFTTYPGEIARIDSAYEMLFAKVPLAFMTKEKAVSCMERKYSPWSVFARSAEITVASCVLLLTLPITVLAALFILAEDGGPIFYSQKRTGKNEHIFSLHKFRSMRTDAEKAGAQWAAQKDARVTRVGAILRKTHIDEIPQLWNIITGELALVGPRPERPEFLEKLKQEIPYYFLRHIVKPGFTGWAQIKYRYARSVDDSREKFEYDLFYIKNRSVLLDLGIVVKTIQIIFTH